MSQTGLDRLRMLPIGSFQESGQNLVLFPPTRSVATLSHGYELLTVIERQPIIFDSPGLQAIS